MQTRQHFITAALLSALAISSGQAETPDSVKTRIGDLAFEQGFPTEETTRKVFDEIDYQRAVQAYLWAYPAVSFESIRIATQAGPGRRLQRSDHCRQLRRSQGPLAHGERHHDLRAWRTSISASRDRSSSRCRPERSSE